MREIIFKVYDVRENQMSNEFDITQPVLFKQGDRWQEVTKNNILLPRFILLQYVGLNDQDRTRVFEGDVLHHDSPVGAENRIYVRWDYNNVHFYGAGDHNLDGSIPGIYISQATFSHNPILKLNGYKIIGNIFQNPELIRSKPL